MSRGPRISEGKKRLIALDLVAGKPLEEVAQTFHVTTGAISRLRREDASFQAMENELASALIEELQRRLRGLAGKAIEVLEEIATLDYNTLPPGAGKALEQKRYAAGDILRWSCTLKALGQEPSDPTEARLEALVQEKLLRSLEGEDRRRETHSQSYGPPSPPPYLFRKPGEALPE